jgi:hypothetical protein
MTFKDVSRNFQGKQPSSFGGFRKERKPSVPLVNSNDLVLSYDFANGNCFTNANTTVTDLSGQGYTGTLTNGPVFNSVNNGIMTFDGVNDFVQLGDVLDLGTNSMTINVWARKTASGSASLLTKTLFGVLNFRWQFAIVNERIYTFLQGNGGSDINPNGNTVINLNTWYLFTSVINRNSAISLYVNGVPETLTGNATISQWNGLDFQNTVTCKIGASTEANGVTPRLFWNGSIASATIHHRVLSASEILQYFNSTRARFGV